MGKITNTAKSPYAKLDSVDLSKIIIKDLFWGPKIDTNYEISLPHQYKECERTGRIDSFRRAAGFNMGQISKNPDPGADSDIYKWIEAVSYELNITPDPALEANLDKLIGLIAKAQDKNGYLDTSFISESQRWKNLLYGHELYCGGHMLQAAIAHHRVTGKNSLFSVAVKWADYVCSYFGPDAHGGVCGHPEVEMALVELYRETRHKRYLDLAIYFVEQRGKKPPVLNGSEYLQDHLPIRKQDYVAGHAVRQGYLACGVADIYAETGDKTLIDVLKKQWNNFTDKKMYITGGAGARYEGEMFGLDYELPNRTAYSETCAAVASFMWNWRMLQVTGDACYADIMEQVLYNGFLSGVSLDGEKYFYTNPLEHDGGKNINSSYGGSNRRTTKHWDHTACCPPNAGRLLASLQGYIYGKQGKAVYIHHYMAGSVELEIGETKIKFAQKTNYPWGGKIEINVNPGGKLKFNLFVRIPGWARNARVELNNKKINRVIIPGTYFEISRLWKSHDVLTLEFPMPIVKVVSNPRVTNNHDCIALKRGPVVYCIEEADYKGIDFFDIALPRNSNIKLLMLTRGIQ